MLVTHELSEDEISSLKSTALANMSLMSATLETSQDDISLLKLVEINIEDMPVTLETSKTTKLC
jgi:hypothetical protein